MAQWTALDMIQCSSITNAIKIDNDCFIVAVLSDSKCIQKGDGIHQFSINTNTWIEFLKYSKSIECRLPSIVWNNKTNQLWMIGDEDQIEAGQSDIIHVQPNDIHEIIHGHYIGESPNILFINNKYHVTGGSDNSSHLIWNEENRTFDTKYKFKSFKGMLGHKTIYIESQNIMLMFGGYDYIDERCFDSVYKFSFDNDEWILLENIKLPHKYHGFASVLTTDERYIILFGGDVENRQQIDEIFILDLDTMSFKLSHVVCPKPSCYHAVLMNDKYQQQLLAFGYLRSEFDKNKLVLPVDIMNMITMWITVDWIHVFTLNASKHWKIALSDILL